MCKKNYVTIEDYHYEHSEGGHLVQGIKGNKVPNRAVAGGNGSFIVRGMPPKIILFLRFSDNSNITYDIYNIVKEYTTRTRITENYANKICDLLLGQCIYLCDNFKEKIDEAVQSAIASVG